MPVARSLVDMLPLVDMLRRLIAQPSISSATPALDHSNKAVVDLLATWLTELGFQAELHPVGGHPGKFNLIAVRGSGPGGLVLAGHTDTVPYDVGRWTQDPFQLSERDGRFYGLGICDMKGFFAVVIEAIRAFDDAEFQQPLIILATADEESSMSGARDLARQGFPKARFAVVGEPTGLKPMRLHKGVMMESLRVTGRSGHSSDPSLGRNALDAMHEMMGELIRFRGRLKADFQNPAFRVAQPTMNFGCIHGGDAANRICGACELQFDLRLLPGMDNDAIRQTIRELIAPVAQRHDVTVELLPLFAGVPAFEEPAAGELVQYCERLTGHASGAVAFATEAPFLQQLGMQTLVMGPGDIAQAHQPDEYLELAQIQPAVNLIKQLIQHFCLE
jgi:acetylornithine deacetylase